MFFSWQFIIKFIDYLVVWWYTTIDNKKLTYLPKIISKEESK